MSIEFSKMMTWHAVGRISDGKLRHPADANASKMMDSLYPDFSLENRNIRLVLAADGFNPFRTISLSHSTLVVHETRELDSLNFNIWTRIYDEQY